MKQKSNNCITGEEKPEMILTKNGLVYLEKSRRNGYAKAVEKLTEGTSDLSELELKEIEGKRMKYYKDSLGWYEGILKQLQKSVENERTTK